MKRAREGWLEAMALVSPFRFFGYFFLEKVTKKTPKQNNKTTKI
jgi:hypothetical protein